MGIDYKDYASKLKITPVHRKGPENTSGYLTPPQLYQGYTPFNPSRIVIHATVGRNTLPYFARRVNASWQTVNEAGSVIDGRLVCAHQLIPKDDYTIYDMVPAGYGCGHCNPGVLHGVGVLNLHAWGIEVENLQNGDGGDPFTEAQYIKLAFTVAYKTALSHIPDLGIGSHWDASMGAILAGLLAPGNAHRDPNSGPFDWAVFYGHLHEVRKPENWPGELWNLPPWDGGR